MDGAGRRRWVAAGLALVLVLAACTSDDGARDDDGDGERAQTSTPAGSVASSPFTVTGVPGPYELLAVGTGDARQTWGEDCCGSDEPYTYLERTDRDGGVVRVAKAGYAGAEGGFSQVSDGYVADVPAERADVDGKDGIWWPGDPDGTGMAWRTWPQLAVDEGDDLAVTVSGEGASRSELEAVYRSIELDRDHGEAPSIPLPPEGFAVVGSVDAEGVLALGARMSSPNWSPGGPRAHSAAWRRGDRELVVLTAPGRSASLEAAARDAQLIGGSGSTTEVRSVDHREVLVDQQVTQSFGGSTTVALQSPWGDLVVVSSSVGSPVDPTDPMPTVDDLIGIASSVEQASDEEWKAFAAEVADPRDMTADPGRTEIERGVVDGVGWLLQTASPGPSNFLGRDAGFDGSEVPDRCIKQSTGASLCAAYTESYEGGVLRTTEDPRFTVIISRTPSVLFRISGGGFPTSSGKMTPLPGGKLWVGVTRSTAGQFWCTPAPGTTPSRIDLLDADGEAVGCVGQP